MMKKLLSLENTWLNNDHCLIKGSEDFSFEPFLVKKFTSVKM